MLNCCPREPSPVRWKSFSQCNFLSLTVIYWLLFVFHTSNIWCMTLRYGKWRQLSSKWHELKQAHQQILYELVWAQISPVNCFSSTPSVILGQIYPPILFSHCVKPVQSLMTSGKMIWFWEKANSERGWYSDGMSPDHFLFQLIPSLHLRLSVFLPSWPLSLSFCWIWNSERPLLFSPSLCLGRTAAFGGDKTEMSKCVCVCPRWALSAAPELKSTEIDGQWREKQASDGSVSSVNHSFILLQQICS